MREFFEVIGNYKGCANKYEILMGNGEGNDRLIYGS